MVIKSSVLLDITPCSPLKVNRRYGGTFRFHLQGQRISQKRIQRFCCFTLISYLAYSLILKMEATYYTLIQHGPHRKLRLQKFVAAGTPLLNDRRIHRLFLHKNRTT
jgi:hypothetical protein